MLKILEISWLVIAMLGLSLGSFKWWTENFSSALWFFLFTTVSLIFWLIRRRQRILMDKQQGQA